MGDFELQVISIIILFVDDDDLQFKCDILQAAADEEVHFLNSCASDWINIQSVELEPPTHC